MEPLEPVDLENPMPEIFDFSKVVLDAQGLLSDVAQGRELVVGVLACQIALINVFPFIDMAPELSAFLVKAHDVTCSCRREKGVPETEHTTNLTPHDDAVARRLLGEV